jgi:itaconyl-CoA hydratase
MYGRYFEEFSVGEVVVHEPSRTITSTELNIHRWILLGRPENFSFNTVQRMVPMWFVLSLCIGMSSRDISARAVGNRWFRDIEYWIPITVGQTVRAVTKVLDLQRNDNETGLVTIESSLFDKGNKVLFRLRRCPIIPFRG